MKHSKQIMCHIRFTCTPQGVNVKMDGSVKDLRRLVFILARIAVIEAKREQKQGAEDLAHFSEILHGAASF